MRKFIDLTGQRFGRLTVVERAPDHIASSGSKYVTWRCLCDCGKTKCVIGDNLKRKDVTSCGCKNKLNHGDASLNSLFGSYQISAKRRNIEFNISIDFFKKTTKMNCYYCGNHPEQSHKPKGTNGGYTYNGIDRIDSSQGYTEGNAVPCCMVCNYSKGIKSEQDFYAWIDRVYHHIHREDAV